MRLPCSREKVRVAVLKIHELVRRLGGRPILCGVDLEVSAGELCVVQGANGSGKSTLLDLTAGVLPADRGQIWIGGYPIQNRRARALLGYAPAAATWPEHLAVHEWMDLVAALRTLPRAATDEMAAVWNIDRCMGSPLRSLSLGERRRLVIATAEFGSPELLLLDEPTVGLDGAGQSLLVDRLQARAVAGKSTLLATHDSAFIAALGAGTVSRVVTLMDGRLSPC